MAGYYQICPNINLSGLSGDAGILWGQKSDDFGDFCGAIYFNTSDQLVLSGHSSTVYSTSSDNLFSVESQAGPALVLKADDGVVDDTRPEMTLYGDLSVTGCIYGTTSSVTVSTDNGICGGGSLSASRNFALSGQASNLHNATFSSGHLLAKDSSGTFVGVASSALNSTTYCISAGGSGSNACLVLNPSTGSDDCVTLAGGNCMSVVCTNADTITVNHCDTSNLSGVYSNTGNDFIQSLTVDGFGHITGISSGTATSGASASGDTHPIQQAIICNLSDGNVLQDITVNTLGHVTTVGPVDLDGRYYTETEVDAFNFCQGHTHAEYDSCAESHTQTTVSANSANWVNTYTNVSSSSANWNNTYTNVSANSANWNNCAEQNHTHAISAVTNLQTTLDGKQDTLSQATTAALGIVELATNAEVTTGTDSDRVITPSNLTSITKLGTIGTGTWQGTAIADNYINSAPNWNNAYTNVAANSANWNSCATSGHTHSQYLTGVLGGTELSNSAASSGIVTINHDNISRSNTTSGCTVPNLGSFTVVDSVTSNARGHITGVNTKTVMISAVSGGGGSAGIATSSSLGLVKLASDTDQTIAANTVTATANRTYGVQFNSADQMVVNVPWMNVTAGNCMSVASGANTLTISHADTSSQTGVSCSSRRYISAVTLDSYGHVTGLDTATEPNEAQTGTQNYIPIWSNSTTLGDSCLCQSGTTVIAKNDLTVNGSVGIGNTNPQGTLDLGNATGGKSIVWGGSSGTTHYTSIWSEYSSGSLVLAGGLKSSTTNEDFIYPHTGTYGYAAIELDSFQDDGIKFYTCADAARTADAVATKQERMRINTLGNVGVGTTNPNQKLTVTGNISASGTVYDGTSNSSQWKEAYNNYITGIGVTGTTTKTITLTQNDGGTVTTTFTDINNDTIYDPWTLSASNTAGCFTVGSGAAVSLAGGSNIDICRNDGIITVDNTLAQATNSALGLVKIGYTENNKNYPVELSSGQMFVNIPWTDNNDNTTYSINAAGNSSSACLVLNPSTGSDDCVVFAGGNCISVARTNADTITLNHSDTSTLSGDYNNTGNTFIQSVQVDAYGHITNITTGTATDGASAININNTNITLSAGNGLTDGGVFSTNQSNIETITMHVGVGSYLCVNTDSIDVIETCAALWAANDNTTYNNGDGIDLTETTFSHESVTRTNNSSTGSPGYGGTFTVIDSITSSARGHITAVNTKTVTLPSADDTNTTYTLNAIDGSGDVTIRLTGSDSTNDDVILCGSSGVSINSSGDIVTIAGPNLSSYCQTHSHSEYASCAEGHTQTTVASNSANWNNAYTNVASNSANWNLCAETNHTHAIACVTGLQTALDSKQACLTFGIANTNVACINSASVADNEYARFTASGLESRSVSEVRSDIGLGSIYNCASTDFDKYTGWVLYTDTTCRGTITSAEEVRFCGGNCVDLSYAATNNVITINHADTSTLNGASNNSGNVFIQDLTFDSYGHVTAIGTGTSTHSDTTYGISSVDVAGTAEVKLRLTDSGSGTDDVTICATQNLSIQSAGDVISITGPNLSSYCQSHTHSQYLLNNANDTFTGNLTVTGNVTAAQLYEGSNRVCTAAYPTNTNQLTNGCGFTNCTGTITGITFTVGTGLEVSGSPITTSGTLDLSLVLCQFNNMTGALDGSADSMIILDSGAEKKALLSTINLGEFCNNQGWNNYSHPTQSSIGVDNSNGNVLQDISVNSLGHVTSVASINLDDRYYTESEVDTKITTAVNDLVNAAPAALDTLDELANALGDDANFAATMTASLASKQCTLTFGIADTNTVRINSTTVADNEYAKFTSSGLSGRSIAEVRSDIGVGDGALTQNNFTNTLKSKLDGIAASANNYSLPLATTTVRGGIELASDTDQTQAANDVTAVAGRTYGIQLNSADQAVVNVPWNTITPDVTATTDGAKLQFTGIGGTVGVGSECDIEIKGTGATTVSSDGTSITISSTDNNDTYSQASTGALGLVELATNAEVTTGTDSIRAITPSNLESITKLGQIGVGTWQGTVIADTYISSASNWNTCATSSHSHAVSDITGLIDTFAAISTIVVGKQESLTFGIADTNTVCINSATVADNEYARFTASGLESRTIGEVRDDIGAATSTTLGLVKLISNTQQACAAEGVSGVTNRTYGLQLNSSNQLVVNVPWSDTNDNTTYSLATSTTLGLVKIGYTESGKNYPVELSSGQMYVNVPWTDNNTTYSAATTSTLGLVKLESGSVQSCAANAITETGGRTYGVQFNSSNQLVVNVPWSDTNTNTNYYANSLSFSSGTLTVGRSGLSNLTVSLDGRYCTSNTNYYANSASFNSSTGNLTIGRSGLSNLTVCLDGRYCTSNDNTTYSAGNGIDLSTTTFSVAAGTGLEQTTTGLCITATCRTAIANGATAHGWGNHGSAGYLTEHPNISTTGDTYCEDGEAIRYITIDSNGHMTAIGYTTNLCTSDYRAKTCTVSYNSGYESVKNVDVYKYVFKEDENQDEHIGMMAHELQESGVEYGVSGYKDEVDEDGNPVLQTVDLKRLVPTLWSALKTAIGKIEKLEARINK